MDISTNSKHAIFKQLHDSQDTFVIPNAWDAGSCRVLTALGYSAIATTSAGLALSLGKRDSAMELSRDLILENARAIVNATELPVSADLEGGFGSAPEDCVKTIKAAHAIGLAGGSIEDATGDPNNPIYDFTHAVERIAAACDAAINLPFLLTARAENYLYARPDLDDTINRLQAFSEAGADVLYAPGLKSLKDIQQLCDAVDKPVNVVMGLSGVKATVGELQAAGVKRISVGGSFARAAMGEFVRAAQEVMNEGTFTYADKAISDSEAMAYMTDIE